MKIRWLKRTSIDLEEAFDWLAERDMRAAWQMLDRARKRGDIDLRDNPEIGPSGRVDGTRELVITGTNYILIYRIRAGEIQILRVLHGAQQWPRAGR